MGALFLLIIAAILLGFGEGSGRDSSGTNSDQVLFHGIILVLVASVLSGLASSLCQWASQVKKHSSCFMNVEMSIVGSLCLLASMSKSPDGEAIRQHGFFHGWTALTVGSFGCLEVLLVVKGLQATPLKGGVWTENFTCKRVTSCSSGMLRCMIRPLNLLFSHTLHEGNSVADALTKLGSDKQADSLYHSRADLPRHIRGSLVLDCTGTGFIRSSSARQRVG
ncbi:uncharacterized protein LOC131226992 [Magnolia sinica]|uniref:uncharacterized protein LOC131226992 n=1 Tax=Magnolia sinica TaxID=86752 RepID=UPI002658180D|nr:uncharacterized protein LOC131226992 [Magnolia sinica]